MSDKNYDRLGYLLTAATLPLMLCASRPYFLATLSLALCCFATAGLVRRAP